MSILHRIKTVEPVTTKPPSKPKRVIAVTEPAKPKNKGGRPKGESRKEQVSIRLDPRILEHYRSLGEGWQAKLNDDLLRLIGLAGHE